MFDNSPEKLAAQLAQVKVIAIVGAKDAAGQPVDNVGRYLIGAGFTVIPVHPKRRNVWGLPTYASLLEIPVPLDCVNLFRAAEYCPDHARETLSLAHKPGLFWMQLGIVSPEARAILTPAGITVVEDNCLMVFHRRYGQSPAGGPRG